MIGQLPLPYQPGVEYWNEDTSHPSPPPRPRKRPADYVPSGYEVLHKTLQKERGVVGKGSYFTVYEVPDNPELVCKAFHGERTDFSAKKLDGLLRHAIKNYKKVREAGVAVAEIVNIQAIIAERCIKQRRVLSPIDPRDEAQIIQISQLFTLSRQKQLEMDLQPQNLRVDNKGIVYLVDFVEEPSELHLLLTNACRAWVTLCKQSQISKEDTTKLLERLDPQFKI